MKFNSKIAVILVALTTLVFANGIAAQEGSYPVITNSWPSSFDELDAFRTQNGSTPEGAVVSLIAALDLFTKDTVEGAKGLVLVLDPSSLQADSTGKGYKGFIVNKSTLGLVERQLQQNPLLINSYLPGSSPSNGYSITEPPYTFTLTANRYSGEAAKGKIKLFIPSSGASSARPVTVTRNSKGVWKVSEFSSILVGVAKASNVANPADDI